MARQKRAAELRGGLHERIARVLGWTESDARGFSLAALRDLVRPVSAKLAHEITIAMSGAVVEARP